MEEYKGIYYGDTNEQQFYEAGAHFRYIDLYNRLEKLFKQQIPNSFRSPEQVIKIYKLYIINKQNSKTRNKILNINKSKTGNTSICNNNKIKETNIYMSQLKHNNKKENNNK